MVTTYHSFQETVPQYRLDKIRNKYIAFFYSKDDNVVVYEDTRWLISKLKGRNICQIR